MKSQNLEQAIAAYELVLQVYTREAFPQQWAVALNNLALAYSKRIRGDRADNLEQAIELYVQAFQIYTYEAFPQQWAAIQNNLAIMYESRIRGDRADNLEEAISAYQQALQVYTREALPEKWAMTQNNLAIAYSDRIRGDRVDSLEKAISAYQQALQVYTREALSEKWAMTQNNLAIAYYENIRGDRADNFEKAITACGKALQVYSREAFPERWAVTQSNLANAYRDRIRGDRADNLEQSIAIYEQALEIYSREAFPERWAMTQTNLAAAYRDRLQGNRSDNLERSIKIYEQALQVYSREAFPEQWAMTQNNLANAHTNYVQGDYLSNLERAITIYTQVLEVYTRDEFPQQWATTQNNLASAYNNRVQGDLADNLKQAISAYELALQVRVPQVFPKDCRQTADNLGNLYFQQQSWSEANRAYTLALQAGEILYQSTILLDSQAAELAETADLPRLAAYAYARIGDLKSAVLTLEQGRGRRLSETLERDRADLTQLQKLAPALYTRYAETTTQLRNLEAQQRLWMTSEDRYSLTPEALRTEVISLRQQFTEILTQICQVPGYESFLQPPTFEDVKAVLRPHNPLFYLIPTPTGSLALIVTPDDITSLWLDDFSATHLREALQSWFDAYGKWIAASQTFKTDFSEDNRQAYQQAEVAWFAEIASITRQLWQPLIAPLIDHLNQRSFQQATLIPTGFLSFLPLHAAWTEDPTTPTGKRYAFDEILFTYAPNARSLAAAQAIADSTPADSILAIDNPRKDLSNSSREVAAAIATFSQSKVLPHEQATREAVITALPHHTILHLSCHGTANLREPLTSGLALSDGLLTLRELLDLKLAGNEQGGIRLAVLSACETGLSGTDLPDEVVSLPTGLLQAGVAGVAASLWSVSDLSTMLLLTQFYDLWRTEGLEISQALHQSQRWVRDTTNAQKYDYLKDHFQKLVDAQQISAQEVNDLLREFMLLYIYPDGSQGQSFAHPFHWAAFTYMGV